MQTVKDFLNTTVPLNFKDVRLSFEAVLGNNSLPERTGYIAAYAVALSTGAVSFQSNLKAALSTEEIDVGEVAAGMMGMTNIYYSYMDAIDLPSVKAMPAQLRMVSYGTQSKANKLAFEVACLAVSIVGKCKPCIQAHVAELKSLGFVDEQFRDIGRLSASLSSLAKVL